MVSKNKLHPEKKITKELHKLVDKEKHLEKDLGGINDRLDAFQKTLDAYGFRDFFRYLKSPYRIAWSNFLAGIFRGLGILVGMTFVVGLLIWFVSQLVDFPLIGSYFQLLLDFIKTLKTPEIY